MFLGYSMSKLYNQISIIKFIKQNRIESSSCWAYSMVMKEDGSIKIKFKPSVFIDVCDSDNFPFEECIVDKDFVLMGPGIKIKSLKGSPEIVPRSTYLKDLKYLESLKYCPKETERLEIKQCPRITSLKGISEKVNEIILSNLNIKKIDYFPDNPTWVLLCDLPIKNLLGLENKCFNDLYLDKLDIENFDYCPQCDYITVTNCKNVKDISGLKNKFNYFLSYDKIMFDTFERFETWWKKNYHK